LDTDLSSLAWPLAQILLSPADIVLIAWGVLTALGGMLVGYSLAAGRITRALSRAQQRRTLAGLALACLVSAVLLFTGLLSLGRAAAALHSTGLLAFALTVSSALLCPALGALIGAASANGKAGWGVNAGTRFAEALTFWWRREQPGDDSGTGADSEPEYELTLASGEEVEAEEREYIENILELGETTAHEVMTPRTDVVALDINWEPWHIISEVAGARFSRFPVYDANIDDICGILHLRDLLEFFARSEDPAALDLRKLLLEPLFVPAGRKIDDVLRELQRRKNHLAIVLDEYGGTAGILTIEDLLEEIVGEIQDEYDDESKLFYQREDGAYVVTAFMPLDELSEVLGRSLNAADVDTLGGYITVNLGRIPKAQEQLELDGLRFTVLSVAKNRIGRVLIERLGEPG
jgi:CBS domain containing-hemolysin-like protein